tara:strand:+ start:165 stop:452 length:288 start_codon:yes stop_codon:yes gene_type:complete
VTENSFLELGDVMVVTTENKGHDPEFWAEQITKKICSISENAAPHVRQQAEAFQTYIYQIVLNGLKNAITSDRTTMVNLLTSQGHHDMAKIIKEL